MTNEQYMLVYTAFQAVGDVSKQGRSAQDKRRTQIAYNTLRKLLLDGHDSIGAALEARGLGGVYE